MHVSFLILKGLAKAELCTYATGLCFTKNHKFDPNINVLALCFRLMNTISEGAIPKFNETLKEKDAFRKVINFI